MLKGVINARKYISIASTSKVTSSYFGVMVPPISVKGTTLRDTAIIVKIYFYSFFKISFLSDSPFRSIRCDEFTIRSKIASAMVPGLTILNGT
jgi:hypothetical protein